MKFKRIICILLCIVFAFSSQISAYAADTEYKTVPEYVRIYDGINELIRKFFGMFEGNVKYDNIEELAELYELDSDYVPQGFCYIDSEDIFAVTYYHAEKNSILVFTDAQTGKRIKTVNLCYDDGDPCKAHVGGIADIGDSLFISSGKTARRLKIADVLNAEDYGKVQFCGTLNTHMQASYINSYNNLLFVGQFYAFTPQNTYETPAEHRLYLPTGERNYALCEVYDMTDIDAVMENESAAPIYAISVPNDVQGITFDGEYYITSASATSRSSSTLSFYSLGDIENDAYITLSGEKVPLYYLSKTRLVNSIKEPPMMEGIDRYNGKIAGIFESGATKFNAKSPNSNICILNK